MVLGALNDVVYLSALTENLHLASVKLLHDSGGDEEFRKRTNDETRRRIHKAAFNIRAAERESGWWGVAAKKNVVVVLDIHYNI